MPGKYISANCIYE